MSNTKKKKHPRAKSIKLKPRTCNPTRKNKKYTCYSSKGLNTLKTLWNIRHPDSKINVVGDHAIWKKLKYYLKDVCSSEECWMRQQFAKNGLTAELTSYTFAPQSPASWSKNKNEWLSSIDIDKVMRQYEQTYSKFSFLGPSPIDFNKILQYDQCVWEELCKFNLKKLIKKNKTKIGMIFNTDPHNKPGAHWISMFVDINKKFIFFFDSAGTSPPKQIINLIDKIKNQGKELDISFDVYINKKSHQKNNTECGIYSIYMISELLQEKKSVDYFLHNNIPDSEMFQLRNHFFNV